MLWVFFLFYPLPHHRHLSSFARPPPTPLSSCVIFWLTPRTPWLDDVIYEQPLRKKVTPWNPIKPYIYFQFLFYHIVWDGCKKNKTFIFEEKKSQKYCLICWFFEGVVFIFRLLYTFLLQNQIKVPKGWVLIKLDANVAHNVFFSSWGRKQFFLLEIGTHN